jgi:hypothetical protein
VVWIGNIIWDDRADNLMDRCSELGGDKRDRKDEGHRENEKCKVTILREKGSAIRTMNFEVYAFEMASEKLGTGN